MAHGRLITNEREYSWRVTFFNCRTLYVLQVWFWKAIAHGHGRKTHQDYKTPALAQDVSHKVQEAGRVCQETTSYSCPALILLHVFVLQKETPPHPQIQSKHKKGGTGAWAAVFRSMKVQVQTYVACLLQGIATPEMGSNLLDAWLLPGKKANRQSRIALLAMLCRHILSAERAWEARKIRNPITGQLGGWSCWH